MNNISNHILQMNVQQIRVRIMVHVWNIRVDGLNAIVKKILLDFDVNTKVSV